MKHLSILLVGLLLIGLIGSVGCASSSHNIDMDELKRMEQEITLGCGVTTLELGELGIQYARKVYEPSVEKDITEGIHLLKPYMTESLYQRMLSNKTTFIEDNDKARVTDVMSCYSNKSSDGIARLYIEIEVEVDEKKQRLIDEFEFNMDGYLCRHYLWIGRIYQPTNNQ